VKKVTIRDVAKHAGVSVATVSHVINNTHYVTPERKDRICAAIKALNYQPNKLARALSQKAIPLLALIVPDLSNPYWSAVARAVQDIADPHNYSVIVCSSDGQSEREARFLRSLSGWVSGLILHPYHQAAEHLIPFSAGDIPVVILGDFTTADQHPAHWDQVTSNNLEGARMVVEHLLNLGHRRIAFVEGLAGAPSSLKRLTGFRSAFEQAELVPDPNLIIAGDYTQAGGRKAAQALFDRADPPTAVFCANDLSALGVLQVAQLRGLRVPQDVSVAGFDDIDDAALATPPLTTFSQPPRLVGTIIAETLLERFNGRAEPARRSIQGTLAIRQSTGPPLS
jgi:DNA-binding LacI/PurR family transcriptional regulator